MLRLLYFRNDAGDEEYIVLTAEDPKEHPAGDWARLGFKLMCEEPITLSCATMLPLEEELWPAK